MAFSLSVQPCVQGCLVGMCDADSSFGKVHQSRPLCLWPGVASDPAASAMVLAPAVQKEIS